VYFQKVITSLG